MADILVLYYSATGSVKGMKKLMESNPALSSRFPYQLTTEAMDAVRDPIHPQYTDHYFTGEYPTRLLDREIAEGRNDPQERQLSFLVSA